MKTSKLSEMTKGWFVGNFSPTLYSTNDCEIAVKEYKKGDIEASHFHKIATEITVVVEGKVKMFDQIFEKGSIIVVEPNEATAFEALEDTINAVVKIPGANNDKFLTGGEE